ncbi:anthrone oxygenase family protein [Sedimentitalea todarodis]|uniref:DUF1772 domain-containing protein n=1 Tax=Sedimentitalea todarodis TaxID=1631240 RepID=A0ABU3VJE9_9RHOB|nr:anthrone oxygenase family protein [Sedimentitalea todarodis]MDU9006130.1 DUF1772 domain-containing protein [Sedimentitalea todarodis]
MRFLLFPMSLLSVLLTGAIFGFFFAWVCSTMWGLDQIDPNIAIEAMQAMNASVRNAVFAPAFFGTPVALLLTTVIAWKSGATRSAIWFALAGIIYIAGGLILTMQINVPMNEALGTLATPLAPDEAERVWTNYSDVWQFWNQVRTVASGTALASVGLGLAALPHRRP